MKKSHLTSNNSNQIKRFYFQSPTSFMGLHSKSHSDGEQISLTLSMSRVNVRQSGVYTCQAENSRGFAQKSERLDVIGEPFVRPMDPLSVVADTSVWIHCPYGGYPIAKIEWSKDGQNYKNCIFY
jgi:hypothetical protein